MQHRVEENILPSN